MRIDWIPKALIHLEEIYLFYSHFSETTATKIRQNIIKEVGLLMSFPFLGSKETTISSEVILYRSLVILKGRYKIIYHIEKERIYIYIVWDCRRNPERLLKETK